MKVIRTLSHRGHKPAVKSLMDNLKYLEKNLRSEIKTSFYLSSNDCHERY